MKIHAAGLSTETNCFAPFPTTYASFVEEGLWRGDASKADGFVGHLVAGWRSLALADGHEFVEGLFATAQPAGPTTRTAFERLRDEIVCQAETEGPFDIVLLFLHGAMVADGYDDCEGDLLERLRGRIGFKTIVGVVLDPHCHLTDSMRVHADILVCAKEYPHTDFPQRMSELYKLCLRVASGDLIPVSAVFDCRMIGYFPTTSEPMSGFVRSMLRAEQERKVESVSFIHGFELGDTPDAGSKMLVYTHDDPDLAEQIATDFGQKIYALRYDLLPTFHKLNEAMTQLDKIDSRVILADVGDNPGAGSACDNMSIMRSLIEHGVSGVVAGCYWDPVVAALCAEVGVGARLDIRVGGKSGHASGPPLDLNVLVKAVKEDHQQSVFDTGSMSFGLSIWLYSDGVDFVVTSKRCQVYSQDAFTGLGIDLTQCRVITIKSGQHFYESFAVLSDNIIYVEAPHTIGLDLAEIPHTKLSFDYFPRVSDPLGLD